MDNSKALPAFFQHGGAVTVLDGLGEFDLEGNGDFENPEDLLNAIIDDVPLNTADEETFADSFGDLTINKLPDYLQNQPYITPGRNVIPDTDDDISEILNSSTAERLKDQAATLAISKALGTPTLNKSTAKSGAPPGLPPGLTPRSTARDAIPSQNEGLGGLTSSSSFLGTPFSSKTSSNPPGLLPARDLTSSFPPSTPPPLTPQREVTAGTPSVVSSILSPAPSVVEGSPAPFFSPPKPNFGRGKYMHVSDVRFVINKVLQPLETQDPYADDFYFIQYTIKKNAIEREKSLQEQGHSIPGSIKVPLPTWKDTKERIKRQLLQSRNVLHMKVKEWEEKEQVLGHRIRSDISKPRELLSIPLDIQELEYFDQEDDNEDGIIEWKSPFTSRLWSTRLSVQRGYEALYTVQELQYLLTSPLIQVNQNAIDEIKYEIDNAVQVLSQALGILTIENESFLGMNTGTSIQLDGRHIAAILQTTMGKKLLTRGLKLLSPQHRWTLIPIVLARILMTIAPNTSTTNIPSSSSTGSVNEAVEVEKKLLKTMIEYLQFTFKQYNEIRLNRIEITISYANDLINHLKQVLKNIMITQMEKNQLKESLLSEKTRAEVMHVIVSLGDHVSVTADPQMQEEWRQTRDAFMSLLDTSSTTN